MEMAVSRLKTKKSTSSPVGMLTMLRKLGPIDEHDETGDDRSRYEVISGKF